jgi:LysM repeat protein
MPPEVVPGPAVVPAVTPPAPAPETETEEDRRRRRNRIQELIDKARKKKEEETPPSPNPTPTPPPNSVDVQPSKPVSWKEIYKLNKDQIKNPNLIYPGQKLKMPNGKKDYEVKQGDSLSKIAARTDLAESRLNSDDQILAIIKGVIH